MTAQQTETELELFTALTGKLEDTPPCDIGQAFTNPPPGIEPCPLRADYSARVHDCGQPDGLLLLVCAGHLQALAGRVNGLLKAHGGFYVEGCGHRVRSVEDFIWSVAPLR